MTGPRPAARAAAPAAGAGTGGASQAAGEAAAAPTTTAFVPPAPCEAVAHARAGATTTRTGVYTARWRGTPAVILTFALPPGSQPAARAYVMARDDCRALAATDLSP